jgi:hypothetical protein
MDRYILRVIFHLLWLCFSCVWEADAANVTDIIVKDAVSIGNAVKNVDMGCFDFQAHGPCLIGDIRGVTISYYEPSLIIKTTMQKGALNSLSGSNLQFHDAHVYDFPLKGLEQLALCTSVTNAATGLRFASELDKEKWHRETVKSAFNFIGTWGPLYPRTGFVNHYSTSVSSGLAALRAVSAAAIGSGHVTPIPILFFVNQLMDKIQMVEPYKMMCMAPGTDVGLWRGSVRVGEQTDKKGAYTWIYWRKMKCCKTALPIPTSL